MPPPPPNTPNRPTWTPLPHPTLPECPPPPQAPSRPPPPICPSLNPPSMPLAPCESNALVRVTAGVVAATFGSMSHFALYEYAPMSEQR